MKPYIREAPTNSLVGLHYKKQKDVSLTANAMIAADQSVMRAVEPKYRVSNLVLFVRLFFLWPSFIATGWWISENMSEGFIIETLGQFVWPLVTSSLFFVQFVLSELPKKVPTVVFFFFIFFFI